MTKAIRLKTMTVFVCGALLFGCGGGEEEAAVAPDEEQVVAPAPSRNEAPQIARVSFDPTTPVPGGSLRVVTEVSDPDGDSVTLSYVWKVNGRSIPASGDFINLENLKRGERLEVTVMASDGKASTQSKTLSATLGNQAPEVKSIRIAFSDGEAAQSGSIVATPIAKDADGDELTFSYRWSVNGKEIKGTSETFDSTPYKRGDKFQVTVIANDGELDSALLTSDPIEMPNRPPQIVSTPPGINEAGEFRYQVQAEDPDDDRSLRYSLGQGPAGMTIDSLSGLIVWKPGANQAGIYSITIGVKDNQGGVGLQEFRLEITVKEAKGFKEKKAAGEDGEEALEEEEAAEPSGEELGADAEAPESISTEKSEEGSAE